MTSVKVFFEKFVKSLFPSITDKSELDPDQGVRMTCPDVKMFLF